MKSRVFFVVAIFVPSLCAQDKDAQIAELDRKLTAARAVASDLQKTIDALAAELANIRQAPNGAQTNALPAEGDAAGGKSRQDAADAFKEQMLRTGLGGDERDSEISARPELFIQSRFQSLPLRGTDTSSAPSNFLLTRMESRWAGRLSEKVGMGFELQYHPAPSGAAEELVNDAFMEYYVSKSVTIRGGQFVKPFGLTFSSQAVRESRRKGVCSRATSFRDSAIGA
jgi:hypothetical protein